MGKKNEYFFTLGTLKNTFLDTSKSFIFSPTTLKNS